MRKLAVAVVLCGVGLVVYGLLSFHAYSVGNPYQPVTDWSIGYAVAPRLEAAIGAVLVAAGWLLWKGAATRL